MATLHFTEATFKKEVLESDLPVLVDFWAEWCGPCKLVGPIVDELAKEYKGKMKIGKVNVDEASGIATHYGIMSIPTLVFLKGGKIIDQVVGALNKTELKKRIEENL
ncbi:MAG: thioredoxin [Candidatus Omnitrophota bacterium]|jgi:thioredoxin 1|nr:MAG: thioredoxin [Candidatus Omnitrophota bacterium]